MRRICKSSSFKNIVKDAVYIDKTQIIYNLLKNEDKVLITRPRRFGKSLTLDTIATLFENGVEPYFKDTWIYNHWYDQKYPVLKLSFIDFDSNDIEIFKTQFIEKISEFAKLHKVEGYEEKKTLGSCIENLMTHLNHANRRIIVLIDEYDCQLCANINNEKLYSEFRNLFRNIYGVLKDQNAIKFMAITGVTRLKDIAIFSVGSDISDITNKSYYSELIGFTRDEIKSNYLDYLKLASSCYFDCQIEDVTDAKIEIILDRIANEYDGYCFDENCEKKVFSTFSVNNFLHDVSINKKCVFKEYWFDVGAIPTILANYLKTHTKDAFEYLNKNKIVKVDSNEFNNPTELTTIDKNVLMCQTGYLTLRSSLNQSPVVLGIPNNEVYKSLLRILSMNFYKGDLDVTDDLGVNILENGTLDDLIKLFNKILNTVSYDNYPINSVSSVQSHIQLYLLGSKVNVISEQHISKGRSDLIIETEKRRIVFEFKYTNDDNLVAPLLQKAIAQIKSKDYGDILPIKDETIKIAAVYNGAPSVRSFTQYTVV